MQSALVTVALVKNTWPKWATTLVDPPGKTVEHAQQRHLQTLTLQNNYKTTITVRNEYMSWEQFYVSTKTDHLDIQPMCGVLAPRGGANNVCDETKPYTDFAHIDVVLKGGVRLDGDIRVLVRTESDQWIYEISPSLAPT